MKNFYDPAAHAKSAGGGAPAKTVWRERNVKKQRHVLAERARGSMPACEGHGLIEGGDAWRTGKRGRDGCGEKKPRMSGARNGWL